MVDPVTTGAEAGAVEKSIPYRRSWLTRIAVLLMLPKEHGAWAMLLIPFVIGTAVEGWSGSPSALALAAVLLPFCGSRSLELVLAPAPNPEARGRRNRAALRLSIYLALAGAATALLVLAHGRWLLLPLGGAALVLLGAQLLLKRHRLDRTWPARLLSIAALSTAGPAALYAATGAMDRQAVAVWVVAFLYSGSGVFYVRLLTRSQTRALPDAAANRRSRAEKQLLAYLALAFLVVAVLTAALWLPPLAGIAFLPLLAKIAWVSARPDHRPTLREIGMAEIGHSAIFTLLAVLTLASW